MLEHVSNGPIFVGAVFLYKRAKCGKSAEKRGNVDYQGFGQDLTGNCISCTFCAIWSEIGPESTSMVGARKSRSERFVCQKSEFACPGDSRGGRLKPAKSVQNRSFPAENGRDTGPWQTADLRKADKTLVSGGAGGNPGSPVAGPSPTFYFPFSFHFLFPFGFVFVEGFGILADARPNSFYSTPCARASRARRPSVASHTW